MSHGIASIISILSKIYSENINKEKTKKMLIEAVNFLLSYQQDTSVYLSYFPGVVSIDAHKSSNSRLAWCYGDLGISVALWNASKVLGNKDWEKRAIEILLHSAKRKDLQKNSVVDAGLCHGTAGIAHIFNKMYQNTNIEELKDTANYWYKTTIEIAKFEDGLAGYKTCKPPRYGGWQNDYSFLTGISGIGLSLISAVSDIEPKWDECLLLSNNVHVE